MKIIFMGTPDFSVPALDSLVNAGHEILAVVTQPDKPKGRGKAVLMTPVKKRAIELSIPVFQPEKVRDKDFVEKIKELSPDVIVVIAFGQILSKELLDIPPYGCINIHASLLPRYRGAAPIQWVIIDGEKETGVTTMRMNEGLDTGDMIDKVVIPIAPKETGGSLHDKLSKAGGKLIVETLRKIEANTAVMTPQTDENTCYAKMLKKSLGDIDWSMSASDIERLIRGLNPWPSAYTKFEDKTLKIWDADVLNDSEKDGIPGMIMDVGKDYIYVKTGDGILSIKELQLEGKKAMSTADFLRGFKLNTKSIFERS